MIINLMPELEMRDNARMSCGSAKPWPSFPISPDRTRRPRTWRVRAAPASRAGGRLGQQAEPEASSGDTERALETTAHHMISTANALASEAGREMLREGGSAVDAAIAAQLVLGLVEPQSSGLGGGAFLIHWNKATKQLKAYDGRETAPKTAVPERFLKDGKPMPFVHGRPLRPLHRHAGRRPPARNGPPRAR